MSLECTAIIKRVHHLGLTATRNLRLECPYCSQKVMEFGVKPKASTVKGLSSVKKSDLIEFATKNGVMVDEKLTKDKLFGLIKRQADEVSRMLEEKTGKKYTRLTAADITENLKTRSLYVPVEVTKIVVRTC